ncbi:MAG: carbohydrate kinase family protein [Bacteroidales bacterium]
MTNKHPGNRKVYALGETVLDLVSVDGLIFSAIPGGSMLNASVSLGRMGIDVEFISEFGTDIAGDQIGNFLSRNAVKTTFSTRHNTHKTSLSLAFLDKEKNASYSFYHDVPEEIPTTLIPEFQKSDILLFGSFYAVKPNRRDYVLKIIKNAVKAGAAIYYDLNIRKAHIDEMDILMPSFMDNIAVASIVKGSDEDFFHLFGLINPEEIYKKINPYCKSLIITCGEKPMHIFTPDYCKSYNINKIEPVSTIGAGDNFNAGFIFGLSTMDSDIKNSAEFSSAEMDRIVGCGLAFAAETCLSSENYIAGNFETDFWKKYI